jgi:hypothetical protein
MGEFTKADRGDSLPASRSLLEADGAVICNSDGPQPTRPAVLVIDNLTSKRRQVPQDAASGHRRFGTQDQRREEARELARGAKN